MEWRCETMSVVLKCCSQWWNKVLCLWDSWPPFLVPTWNETIENCSSGIVLEVMRFCNGSVALANPQGINPYQISAPSYLFFWCNGEESPACSLIKLILLQPYCLWNSNMFFFSFYFIHHASTPFTDVQYLICEGGDAGVANATWQKPIIMGQYEACRNYPCSLSSRTPWPKVWQCN